MYTQCRRHFIWQKHPCGPSIFLLADSHLIHEMCVSIYTHTYTHNHETITTLKAAIYLQLQKYPCAPVLSIPPTPISCPQSTNDLHSVPIDCFIFLQFI